MINIKTYYDWHQSDLKNDIGSKVKTISMAKGMTEEEVKSLPLSELGKMYVESITSFTDKSNPVFAVKYKGEELYFSMPTEGSIGEVADIETKLGSNKPWKILSVFFRPCEVDKTQKPWVDSQGVKVKEIGSFNEDYSKYRVLKYDIKDERYEKYQEEGYWDDFPASIYNATLDFIAGIGTSYLLATKTYSRNEEPLDREQLSQLVAHLAILGDGIRSYSTWRKVTFSKSMEMIA